MDSTNMKDIIREKAIELFSKKGFYGTSIRDIAKEAGCSIPMLYYYYHNKNELFEEIVYNEFISLIERLNSTIPKGVSLEEVYFQAVKQRKELSSYDRAVYKLAMKVWLGFEGSLEIREKLKAWEAGRYDRNRKILSKICTEETLDALTDVMLGIFENLTQRIILLDEEISDDQIRRCVKLIINL